MRVRSRPQADPELDALRKRVHGVCCHACGVRRASGPERVMRAGLDGRPLEYGTCAECAAALRRSDLDRRAVAAVLDLDRGAATLAGVTVERFVDLPHARPDRPNPTPWAHLDLSTLAAVVDRNRLDIERRTGGPCYWCGATLTGTGTSFQNGGRGVVCGSCFDRFSPLGQQSWRHLPDGQRDYCATVLCALDRGNGLQVRRGLGLATGLAWWHETGRTDGATYPFAHLDLAKMRTVAADMITRRDIEPPEPSVRWSPESIGQIQW